MASGHLTFLSLYLSSLFVASRGFVNAYITKEERRNKANTNITDVLWIRDFRGSGSRRQRTNETRKKRRNPCFEVLDVHF
jgi:hypothetical protein